MNPIKALMYCVVPERCSDCHIVLPSFFFPVLNWHSVNLCRRCFNKTVVDPRDPMSFDHYHFFNPIRDLKRHFQWLVRR